MKAVIYCRVSSLDQVSGTSLETQHEACLHYAAEQTIDVVATFIERGESATAATRTELLRALDYCRKHRGQIAAFIVWKIDRFARNTTDHYGLQAELAKYGTRLCSVTEPIISEGPIGRMAEAMLAGYAQFENDIRKQRCEAGIQRKIAEGIWPWRPPVGYIHSKRRMDRRKTAPDDPDPIRFPLIQRALREFASGHHTIASLTRSLRDWGLRSSTGRVILRQFVDRMLTEKFYAGILRNPFTGEEHPGSHHAMITVAQFYAIQARKAALSNGAVGARRFIHPDFPLRNFVACICGRPLTGSWQKGRRQRYAYYYCFNPACQYHHVYIPNGTLEDRFRRLLNGFRLDDDAIDRLRASVKRQLEVATVSSRQQLAAQQQTLARLQSRKQRLLEIRLSGEITQNEYVQERRRIETEISLAQSRTTQETDPFDVDAAFDEVKDVLATPALFWSALERVEYKRELQNVFFHTPPVYDVRAERFRTAKNLHLFKRSRAPDLTNTENVAASGHHTNPMVEAINRIRGFVEWVRSERDSVGSAAV